MDHYLADSNLNRDYYKCIINSVYDIWRTLNFWLFSIKEIYKVSLMYP